MSSAEEGQQAERQMTHRAGERPDTRGIAGALRIGFLFVFGQSRRGTFVAPIVCLYNGAHKT